MKSKILTLILFLATAGVVALYPSYQSIGAVAPPPNPPQQAQNGQKPVVEVVFVLDTTGSMGGLIQAAKEKIWSIAGSMAQAQPAPDIRMGLVAYRDRGDDYVTRVIDLSSDLDSMYATLMDFQANGGGDGQESVNQALSDAVNKISWSSDPNAYKVVFLVGDAPPHMDYTNDVKYPVTLADAKRKGILVNTIQCGADGSTTREWQQIAQLGVGRYFRVEQAGNAVAVATPYDKEMAELSAKLDKTRLYYGTDEERRKKDEKLAAADKLKAASVESQARRAAFNASASGATNLAGEKELVDDVAKGRVDLSKVAPASLPEPLQALSPEQRKAVVEEKAQERQSLLGRLKSLSTQRGDFLKQKVEETLGADAKSSLDHQVYDAVREQAGKKGFRYEKDAPEY
jgi:Mg-chelatase subunit ChlD